ncbi:hypothetical protein [Pelagicoccus mobilis]|nr:hypothetical protein [Pelagicoccus mobilis]
MSSEDRAEKLDTVKALVSVEVRAIEPELLDKAPSPFSRDLGLVRPEEEAAEEEIPLSDEELLQALSDYVNPTGIFMFGGEFYLVFKERKMKVGSEILIRLNGKEYTVLVTEITGSTYRIRRGDAELQLKLK